jgi:type IV secretory pathway VirB6-like protein
VNPSERPHFFNKKVLIKFPFKKSGEMKLEAKKNFLFVNFLRYGYYGFFSLGASTTGIGANGFPLISPVNGST